jgi:hypothetical protein
MQCPVCGGVAIRLPKAERAEKSVRCPVDGDFDLAMGCRAILEKLEPEQRQRVLDRAIKAAGLNERPIITTSSF